MLPGRAAGRVKQLLRICKKAGAATEGRKPLQVVAQVGGLGCDSVEIRTHGDGQTDDR